MSRVPLNHGNVPLFVRSRIFFARAQFVTLPRCPDVNHPIERRPPTYGNFVRFLAKIPNGTAAESPCYSVFWNAIDFCRLYTSNKNINVGPANRPAFCRQVPLFYAKYPSKTFSRLAVLHTLIAPLLPHRFTPSYAPDIIGVNISEQKSGTERMKKRKKRESVIVFTTRGRNWYCSTSSRRYTYFARATITRCRGLSVHPV